MSTTSAPASTRWRLNLWVTLTGVLAFGDLLIGVSSPVPQVRWPALVAGVLILATLARGGRSYRLGVTVLIAAAVIPTVTTWWSLVSPATAVLVVGCGIPALRSRRHPHLEDTTPGPLISSGIGSTQKGT